MNFVLSKNSLKRLEGVHPDLVAVVKRAITITQVDFVVTSGVRTQQEQADLYAQGRTKPGPIVTWTLNSRHIGGFAVDLAAYVGGKISWDTKHYVPIAWAMKRAAIDLTVPIEWGGDWKRKDMPHFELDRGVYKNNETLS